MKPIRSKLLYQYLKEQGVLDMDEAQITHAKKEYRRLYKKQWAENHKGLKKDIRISLTQKEYSLIRHIPTEPNMTLPSFTKALLLAVANKKQRIPDETELIHVIQSLSVTISASHDLIPRPILNQYLDIETKLRAYIDAH